MPRLLAISDLHVRHKANRAAVGSASEHLDDWLIIAGDVCEKVEDLAWVLDTLGPRFARLLWVPGNHELWSPQASPLQGVARYEALVEVCRSRGVSTPEDPWPVWDEGGAAPHLVALLFLLYDYTFRPPGFDAEGAVRWAGEAGIVCMDELRLSPEPGRRGAPTASPPRPAASPPNARTCPGCWSTTGRCDGTSSGSRGSPASCPGVAPRSPRTGTRGTGRPWSSRATCTCGPPTGATG